MTNEEINKPEEIKPVYIYTEKQLKFVTLIAVILTLPPIIMSLYIWYNLPSGQLPNFTNPITIATIVLGITAIITWAWLYSATVKTNVNKA
jgi:hypothetical protein